MWSGRGIKALFVVIIIVLLALVVLGLTVQLVLLLLPLILLVLLLSYLFKILNRIKRGGPRKNYRNINKNYINVDYKVKK